MNADKLTADIFVYNAYLFEKAFGITQMPARVFSYGAFVEYRLSK